MIDNKWKIPEITSAARSAATVISEREAYVHRSCPAAARPPQFRFIRVREQARSRS